MAEKQIVDTSSEVAEQTLSNVKTWLPEWIVPYWDKLQDQPLLLMLIVLALGYVLAKLIQWTFKKVAGVLTAKTKNSYDDRIIGILSKPIFAIIFFGSLLFAIEAYQFASDTDTTLKRLVVTILIMSLMATVWKGAKIVLEALSNNRNHFTFVEERTIPLLNIVTQLLTVGLAIYFIILLWGKDPTAWLASAGVMGIALGFAAKDTLSNLFAGFFIVADSPYKLGDYIVLDSGERGMVSHVGIRSTSLMTRDNVEVTVPNSVMGNAKIVNESGGPSEKTRIRLPVGVAYETDLELAVKALQEEAEKNEMVLNFPEPKVRAKLFGPSSVDFQLQFWIDKPELRGRILHNMILAIHKRFREEGIEIPYSKQDLYIKKIEDELN